MRRKKKFDYDKPKTAEPDRNWVGTMLWVFFLGMMALATIMMFVELWGWDAR